MKQILCQRIDIIHSSKIKFDSLGNPVFLDESSFTTLQIEDIAEYLLQTENNAPGTAATERVRANIKPENALFLTNTSLKWYVLRLYTNDSTFYVGSPEYPAEFSFSDSKKNISINFNCSKPK